MTIPRALVFGEALIDRVASPDGAIEHPGGSPMNVAIGLARLGVKTTLATQFGSDSRGDIIRAHLENSGVHLDVFSSQTSVAEAQITEDGSATYDFAIEWTRPAIPVPLGTDIVHTGSLACFLTPGAASSLELLTAAGEGTLRSLDPNIRPALLDHHEALAQYSSLVEQADVVKMSDEDAEWLYPGKDIDAVLDDLLSRGVGLAAITNGAAGSVLASTAARVRVSPVAGSVVDTIGAGDSFMSGLLYAAVRDPERGVVSTGRMTEAGLERLGRFAARCAAITVSRAGANPPSAADLS